MSEYPTTAERRRPGTANGLRTHATALRERAERLRTAAADVVWHGPQADAFRSRVEELARRCDTAADGLARSAVRFDDRPGRR